MPTEKGNTKFTSIILEDIIIYRQIMSIFLISSSITILYWLFNREITGDVVSKSLKLASYFWIGKALLHWQNKVEKNHDPKWQLDIANKVYISLLISSLFIIISFFEKNLLKDLGNIVIGERPALILVLTIETIISILPIILLAYVNLNFISKFPHNAAANMISTRYLFYVNLPCILSTALVIFFSVIAMGVLAQVDERQMRGFVGGAMAFLVLAACLVESAIERKVAERSASKS